MIIYELVPLTTLGLGGSGVVCRGVHVLAARAAREAPVARRVDP